MLSDARRTGLDVIRLRADDDIAKHVAHAGLAAEAAGRSRLFAASSEPHVVRVRLRQRLREGRLLHHAQQAIDFEHARVQGWRKLRRLLVDLLGAVGAGDVLPQELLAVHRPADRVEEQQLGIRRAVRVQGRAT